MKNFILAGVCIVAFFVFWRMGSPIFFKKIPSDIYVDKLIEEDTLPLKELIRENPSIKEDMVRLIRTARKKGQEPKAAAYQIGVSTVAKYTAQYVAKADDKVIAEFLDLVTRTLESFLKNDATNCYHWLYGGRENHNLMARLPQELQDEHIAISRRIINSGMTDNIQKPKADISATLEKLAYNIVAKHGDNKIDFSLMGVRIAKTKREKSVSCHTTYRFHQALNDLPEEERAITSRTLFYQAVR